ncbi:hypothetical protein AMTRI_Chr05g63150 [Amborella trichopoda]|uniref:Pentacotripeptide-repeat region of PRORP domain-containing protein n=1 Tax=Amborella trichopoda TaxID=13333 RepID=W1NT26_AMBTC|nr:pentatricopeptide repeat-containing protein At1g80150, mitochondrial [Amborella trichopoda]XP_020519388.1 pentatricopeptide repeat-containing protein At1g80150, mitochondrial [Amborella trichopoda]ERN00377.1 hypothetical protein AMTR_s00104p00121350 [Amborella trichopoda]|eukprot:XP_006837808.3 pentatricopeptide repeat-containing protein At1g80150, mitochondrial [Amborella trichopoda]
MLRNMLSSRLVRRLSTISAITPTISSSPSAPSAAPHLLAQLKEERDPEKLFLLFQRHSSSRLLIENSFAYKDMVSRLAGAGRHDLVAQILEPQLRGPLGRRHGFVLRVTSLYAHASMVSHAINAFYIYPTTKTFNAALSAIIQSKDLAHLAQFFSETPRAHGFSPDSFSFNLVIKAFSDMGFLDTAYLYMVEMENAGIKPDIFTYTTLMDAFYKNNQPIIANGLWNLMGLKGVRPNLATFNSRIQYLINKRKNWQAWNLTEKLVSLGIEPDETTYNLLIKGFSRVGHLLMAKRIFFSLGQKLCSPNSKIYQTMIHYLCKNGEFDLAFKLCKESMSKNWFPNFDTITKLVEGLVESSNHEKGREILELVKRRVPPMKNLEVLKALLG